MAWDNAERDALVNHISKAINYSSLLVNGMENQSKPMIILLG
jgi:hypothetical protein